jgi:hypothetical protein
VGNGGCCLTPGNTVFSTFGMAVAVGLDVGVTVGLAGKLVGVPWDNGVAAGMAVSVAVMVAGTGRVLVAVALPDGGSAHRSPGPGCPANAMVPRDRSR